MRFSRSSRSAWEFPRRTGSPCVSTPRPTSHQTRPAPTSAPRCSAPSSATSSTCDGAGAISKLSVRASGNTLEVRGISPMSKFRVLKAFDEFHRGYKPGDVLEDEALSCWWPLDARDLALKLRVYSGHL